MSSARPVAGCTAAMRGKASPVLRNDARLAARRLVSALRAADAARTALEALRHAQEVRLGVAVPADPELVDVLAGVRPEAGGIWRWTGQTNREGTATVVTGGRRRSVARALAEAFGLLEPGDPTMLQPRGDRRGPGGAEDVNPWHRTGVQMPTHPWRSAAESWEKILPRSARESARAHV